MCVCVCVCVCVCIHTHTHTHAHTHIGDSDTISVAGSENGSRTPSKDPGERETCCVVAFCGVPSLGKRSQKSAPQYIDYKGTIMSTFLFFLIFFSLFFIDYMKAL
jgi:hypothetical protein